MFKIFMLDYLMQVAKMNPWTQKSVFLTKGSAASTQHRPPSAQRWPLATLADISGGDSNFVDIVIMVTQSWWYCRDNLWRLYFRHQYQCHLIGSFIRNTATSPLWWPWPQMIFKDPKVNPVNIQIHRFQPFFKTVKDEFWSDLTVLQRNSHWFEFLTE